MESINHSINDSYNMPWNHSQTHSFPYQQGVHQIPPQIYTQNHGNNDHMSIATEAPFNYLNYDNNEYNNEYKDSMPSRVITHDHILPMIPNTTPSINNTNNNNYSNNNFNGYYNNNNNNNNNILMPTITSYDNDTNSHSSSTASASHYSPKQSPNIIPNINKKPNMTMPHMENLIK
eukprot:980223_1